MRRATPCLSKVHIAGERASRSERNFIGARTAVVCVRLWSFARIGPPIRLQCVLSQIWSEPTPTPTPTRDNQRYREILGDTYCYIFVLLDHYVMLIRCPSACTWRIGIWVYLSLVECSMYVCVKTWCPKNPDPLILILTHE